MSAEGENRIVGYLAAAFHGNPADRLEHVRRSGLEPRHFVELDHARRVFAAIVDLVARREGTATLGKVAAHPLITSDSITEMWLAGRLVPRVAAPMGSCDHDQALVYARELVAAYQPDSPLAA